VLRHFADKREVLFDGEVLRARVIAVTPALREREVAKVATLVTFLTDALIARGVDARIAQLCAQVGMGICAVATRRWMHDPSAGLDAEIEAAFRDLHEVSHALGAKR
jgi:hypothetical protein